MTVGWKYINAKDITVINSRFVIGEKIMKNIKAVIFDLDDTLTNRKAQFYKYSLYFINKYFKDKELPDTIENMLQFMILLDNNGQCNKYEFYKLLIEKWGIENCTSEQLRDSYKEIFLEFTTPY